MVTHLVGLPGLESAVSKDSIAPLVFFSFFTIASTAFSAHFSSSSPCFHPSRRGEGEERVDAAGHTRHGDVSFLYLPLVIVVAAAVSVNSDKVLNKH